MAKIILLALGILFVYWLLKGYRRRVDSDSGRAAPPVEGESMVKCAQCGVHLPRSESITTSGSFYCSAEHQRAHQAGRST
jgi:uncharacterized protein